MLRKICAHTGLFVASVGVLFVLAMVGQTYGIAASNGWHPVAVDVAGLVVLTVVRGRLGIHAP